ncbi:MAG: hypothetical protein GX213_13110 [Clostridiaceae bacterium]|nr:hypothetical protein [Clostridiaceae bacterium]
MAVLMHLILSKEPSGPTEKVPQSKSASEVMQVLGLSFLGKVTFSAVSNRPSGTAYALNVVS